ncbi:Stress responsive A/B Barrel Domain protein [Limihaloglobus sulfuriphilus]|uniref:Stress responsive A/B Barrel Domain protein n=1 Tax=Limihaloglobus sulfuriphilus TaxID=1851148 RepID=A0A1Q2MIE0_9BACT|nr:Dabb family protein [Limihaloglobus sulfuriphilus]AQQ72288.1 Stress responsive A/B Barrel Domain protein [Limihaloglobus sulfuriphilus]
MLVHTVLFWLKDDVTDDDREFFAAELEKLKGIECAHAVYVGTPAATERPVIDSSYDFCLTVILPDTAAHDTYQYDPLHVAFVEKCKAMFGKILIYDAD